MRVLITTLTLLCIAEIASGEVEQHLAFNSPNKRWQVIAQWFPHHSFSGYLFCLKDRLKGKTYFKQTAVDDNEALPYRFSVIWNPNSRYAAVNLYYGRIAQEVVIIDVSGKTPEMHPLFSSADSDLNDFVVGAVHWRNATDLEVEADLPRFVPQQPGRNTYFSLVVRFTGHESTIIKKIGSSESSPDT